MSNQPICTTAGSLHTCAVPARRCITTRRARLRQQRLLTGLGQDHRACRPCWSSLLTLAYPAGPPLEVSSSAPVCHEVGDTESDLFWVSLDLHLSTYFHLTFPPSFGKPKFLGGNHYLTTSPPTLYLVSSNHLIIFLRTPPMFYRRILITLTLILAAPQH